jgi:hypothetical protein
VSAKLQNNVFKKNENSTALLENIGKIEEKM